MRIALRLLVLALFLSGCSGGGGNGTSIKVSPTSLSFDMGTDSDLPPSQEVSAQYSGDGLLVGYPPGIDVPEWLQITQTSDDAANPVKFAFSISDSSLPEGTYQTTVRFVTGHVDGSDVQYSDVGVTLSVQAQTISVDQSNIEFEAVSDGNLPAATASDISSLKSGTMDYAATVTYSGDGTGWLSGALSGTAPATLTLRPSTTALSPGMHTATITLKPTTGPSTHIFVTYNLTAATLSAAPASIDFTATSDTHAQRSQVVELTDDGALLNWQATAISQHWLSLTPSSGNTHSSGTFTLSVDPAYIQSQPSGNYSATITLTYSSASSQPQTIEIPVTLQLETPTVTAVSPGYLEQGSSLPLVLRGKGLEDLQASDVTFGGIAATAVQHIANNAVKVTPPTLSSGSYTVAVRAGSATSSAPFHLVVGSSPAYASAEIPTSGFYSTRLIYDPFHKVLYANDRASGYGGALYRFRQQNGQWLQETVVDSSFEVYDFTQSLDGKALYLASPQTGHIYSLDLTTENAVPVPLSNVYGADQVVTIDDGRLYLLSGYYATDATLYDPKDGSTYSPQGSSYYTYCGLVLASGDGSQVFTMPGGCVSPEPGMALYDTSADHFSFGVSDYDNRLSPLAISRDGSKMVHYDTVYDFHLNVLGSVTGGYGLAFSPDGNRLYSLTQDNNGYNLKLNVSDVSKSPGANGYPLVDTLSLSDGDAYSSFNSNVAVTPEGATYFLLDTKRLLVVPIPAADRTSN